MSQVSLASASGKWLMASTILASAMAFIDSTALNVVLPSLQQDLNAQGTDLFWILNAYLLMLASLVLIGGTLGDKLGRKKVFITGIIVFMAGSIACGLSPNVYILIASRLLQGIGGACMIPGSLSLISSAFSDKERGKAIGTWSAITTVVTIGGPILGGYLGDAGLWRLIFFINVPIGITSIIILYFKVRESRDDSESQSVDYPGALSIIGGLALLTFGFLRMPNTGFNDLYVYLSLGVGMLLILVFIIIEKKSKHPMMPLQLFNNKTFTGANLLTFFLYAGLSAGMLFLTLYLVQLQHYSQLQAGLSLLPFTILMVFLSRLAGKLTDQFGPRWFLITGPALAGFGFLLLSFVKQTSGPQEYWTTFLPGIAVFGFGMSITVAPLTTTVMGSVPNHFSGAASGVNNAMTRISSVFANAILGALAILFFTGNLRKELNRYPLDNDAAAKVMAEAADLGNAAVPPGISAGNRQFVQKAFDHSFIISYHNVMFICAALAWTGAVMSFVFIKNKEINTD